MLIALSVCRNKRGVVRGMKKGNTMSIKGYIIDNAFWALFAMVCYRNLFFRHADGLTFLQSKLLLWGLVIGCVGVGVLSTVNRRRNYTSIVANVLMPYEIYAVITYGDIIFDNCLWMLIAIGLVVAGVFICVLVLGYLDPRHDIVASIIHGAWLSRTVVSVSLAVAFLPFTMNAFLGNALFASTEIPQNGIENKVTIADNIETVANLREEVWAGLTLQERIDTLQVVANIESSYLGLPHELNVGAEPMEESTVAFYTDRNHQIRINIDYLESFPAKETLAAVCHEAHHALQYALCDLWDSIDSNYRELIIFENVPSYKENFANYRDTEDDFLAYYLMECEQAARQYAEESVEDYYYKIDYYLSGGG